MEFKVELGEFPTKGKNWRRLQDALLLGYLEGVDKIRIGLEPGDQFLYGLVDREYRILFVRPGSGIMVLSGWRNPLVPLGDRKLRIVASGKLVEE